MGFPCSECDSTFREKKNLQQHLKNRHGFKKFKCNFCHFHSDDQSHLKRHEETVHKNELFTCEQCEYMTPRKDKLLRHTRTNHVDKNIRCQLCEYVTDRIENMKRHKEAKHEVKYCNECDFTTSSLREMKNHKNSQHPPDEFHEESAFNKLLYNKIWHVDGMTDLTVALHAYKPKIRNTISDYIKEKGGLKWYLGAKVTMHKVNRYGDTIDEATPGFTTSPRVQATMWNFDQDYNNASEKIKEDFVAFNQNGSGWILKSVNNISVNIGGYGPNLSKSQREKAAEADRKQQEFENML